MILNIHVRKSDGRTMRATFKGYNGQIAIIEPPLLTGDRILTTIPNPSQAKFIEDAAMETAVKLVRQEPESSRTDAMFAFKTK